MSTDTHAPTNRSRLIEQRPRRYRYFGVRLIFNLAVEQGRIARGAPGSGHKKTAAVTGSGFPMVLFVDRINPVSRLQPEFAASLAA